MTQHLTDAWHSTSYELPPEGKRIDWMDSRGNVTYGGFRRGKLWFIDDMYVYYTPTMWRYAAKEKP